MRKNLIIFTAGIMAGCFIMLLIPDKKQEKWIPVLETTGFEYMNDTLIKIIEDVKEAEEKLEINQTEKLSKTLHKIMNELLQLQSYYLPMTNVRQLIYDSERLFTLKKTKEALNNLEKAKMIMEKVGMPANELFLMVDELILMIKESSKTVQNKFKEVGRKSNLMVLKGGLFLNHKVLK